MPFFLQQPSLQRRLTLLMSGVALLALLIPNLINQSSNPLSNWLTTSQPVLSELVKTPLSAAQLTKTLSQQPNWQSLVLLDSSGHLLFGSGPALPDLTKAYQLLVDEQQRVRLSIRQKMPNGYLIAVSQTLPDALTRRLLIRQPNGSWQGLSGEEYGERPNGQLVSQLDVLVLDQNDRPSWLISLLLSVFVSGLLSHLLIRPLTILTQTAENIAIQPVISSDRLPERSTDRTEIGRLRNAFRKTVEHLIGLIDEQKGTNQALQQARAETEQANQIKDRFLKQLSHELRTPLNTINGYSELQLIGEAPELLSGQVDLKTYLASLPNEARRTEINTYYIIWTQGQRLLSAVERMVDLSRLEDSRLTFQYENCDPQALLNELRQMLQAQPGNTLDILSKPDPELVHQLELPVQLVRTMLNELAIYSVRHTLQGQLQLSARSTSHQIIFSVSDNGPGIAWNELNSLREPLGAFGVSQRTVQALGGSLDISSSTDTVHHGSLFTLILPTQRPR